MVTWLLYLPLFFHQNEKFLFSFFPFTLVLWWFTCPERLLAFSEACHEYVVHARECCGLSTIGLQRCLWMTVICRENQKHWQYLFWLWLPTSSPCHQGYPKECYFMYKKEDSLGCYKQSLYLVYSSMALKH